MKAWDRRLMAASICWQGPSMQKGEFPPAFPLKHQQKDLRLALELADSVDQPLPVAAAANSAYLKVGLPMRAVCSSLRGSCACDASLLPPLVCHVLLSGVSSKLDWVVTSELRDCAQQRT